MDCRDQGEEGRRTLVESLSVSFIFAYFFEERCGTEPPKLYDDES